MRTAYRERRRQFPNPRESWNKPKFDITVNVKRPVEKGCDHNFIINVHQRACQFCNRLETNLNFGTGRPPKWVKDLWWDEK